MAEVEKTKPPIQQPLIPEHYIDTPSQRLYVLSLGLICQAIKILDFFRYLASNDLSICRKWLLVDLAYCLVLAKLKIPRLSYSTAVVLLQIIGLWLLDGFMFGGIHLNVSPSSFVGESNSGMLETSEPFNLLSILSPLTFGLIGSSEHTSSDSHLLGQHTIRMSPISRAKLNLAGGSYCLSSSSNPILIPVLLNNTNPISLRYSLTPLGTNREESPNEVEYIDLYPKDLKAIEQARLASLQVVKGASTAKRVPDEYDEYDDEEETSDDSQRSHSSLQRTEALIHIRLAKPGIVRLERVIDASNIEARLSYPLEVTIAPCPRVQFAPDAHKDNNIRCAGQNTDANLMLDINGVPPLSLRWFKYINNERTEYVVDGIEGTQTSGKELALVKRGVAQRLQIPLAVSFLQTGTHLYGLQEITDAVGNVVRVDAFNSDNASLYTRSFKLLGRPTMSFKHCRAGSPTSILIGQEASLDVDVKNADALDAPWEIVYKYKPVDGDSKEDKRLVPWSKTIKADRQKDLVLKASAPGEYTLASLKGVHCEGDIMAPDTCVVVERPRPTAEIEWKKIHECSGDTGVSASLVLHGTPPFRVHYRVQHDKEGSKEEFKTYTTSRGEFSLQPERSGHYVFSFIRISDAYYQVPLDGPSIDQVIHPLATAEFASTSGGRNQKRSISSCEGSFVDVDVDLRGTAPLTLEVQVVGPKGAEIITVPAIDTARKQVQIPIPKSVDKNGGTFEVVLVSVEDKYKCKRTLEPRSLVVNVRRVKSTARFYGDTAKRRVSILEGDTTALPLRLTGDGGWTIKYRRKEAEQVILTARLDTPNAELKVSKRGLYEILSIHDSQCPGSVIQDASTYQVNWIPRPSAKLAENTVAHIEPYNGSYILPPICANAEDHVDLNLLGRPPFQLMYNIAQDAETGGTKILDQPIFNSIQHHTRFQLDTSHPGRMYYEVKQIGDASYPLSKHAAVIPRSERLLFEQQVLLRPTAEFRTSGRLSYCLHDSFTALDGFSGDGTILLRGTPPFKLKLFIKNIISSKADVLDVETYDTNWKVNLPAYEFKSIGAHHVMIKSVSDASNCAHGDLGGLITSIWVDVAETAAIVPFDRREDYCVGEVSQFQLEGIPPWTIGYRINNKAYTHEAKVSPFSFTQQHAGDFTVTSISHQQKLCKAAVTDLHLSVHALPSAQVGHGKRIYQDIHEGDQAEIVFTLIGEPPFTFTYQRSEPSQVRGKLGKILETHTVSRVYSKEYSIYSALEGTWTVTSISDKYCRYPVQPN